MTSTSMSMNLFDFSKEWASLEAEVEAAAVAESQALKDRIAEAVTLSAAAEEVSRPGIECKDGLAEDVWNCIEQWSIKQKEDETQSVTSNDKQICTYPSCGSEDILLDEGNYVCRSCGTIQDRFIDAQAEWRYYGADDNKTTDPTRCGVPQNDLFPGMSMGTVIGTVGQKVPSYMFRLSKHQTWYSIPYKERNLYNIINSMTLKAVNGGISTSIIDEAKVMYKRLSEMKLSRGENREGLIASSIYMSCKKNNVPRSAKEIAKMFNLNITSMTRGCKRFQELIDMKLKYTTTAHDFVRRFCSKMDFSGRMVDMCLYVVEKEEAYSIISENAPPSIAAGCIFLANQVCGWNKPRKEIAAACDISEITINKCYKKLVDYAPFLFPSSVDVSAVVPKQKKSGSRK